MFPSQLDPSKKFGSRFKQRKFDDVHKGDIKDTAMEPMGKPMSTAHEQAEIPQFEAGEKEGQQEAAGMQHPVVAEHGKAVKATVTHDHANNRHHVVSRHEDGFVNTSDHDNAQGAHDEAAKLAGVEPSPEAAQAEQSQASPKQPRSPMGNTFGGDTEAKSMRSMPGMA